MGWSGGACLSTCCVMGNLSCEGWMLSPFSGSLRAATLQVLPSFYRKWVLQRLAVTCKHGAVSLLARSFVSGQGVCLEPQRFSWLFYLCSVWDWLHLSCRWWLCSSKEWGEWKQLLSWRFAKVNLLTNPSFASFLIANKTIREAGQDSKWKGRRWLTFSEELWISQ